MFEVLKIEREDLEKYKQFLADEHYLKKHWNISKLITQKNSGKTELTEEKIKRDTQKNIIESDDTKINLVFLLKTL